MGSLLPILTFLAALGSGLMAGFFFAFSATVMWALERQPPAAGISAMQAINVVVLNPLFLGTFFGTAILSLVLDIVALMDWSAPWVRLSGRGQPALFRRHLPGDGALQRAAQQQARRREAGERRGQGDMDALPLVCGRRGTMCAR